MIGLDLEFRRGFVRENSRPQRPAIVPELLLHLAGGAAPIWKLTEDELKAVGLPPPYWSYAWAGGQGLARYLLDHPDAVAGKRVVDFATGSGVVAIAAARAGAAAVLAADIDPFCEAAAGLNAELNGVALQFTDANLLELGPPDADVIVAGDVWYRGPLADQLMAWLAAARARGTRVLLGDPGRTFFPTVGVAKLAAYAVPTIGELEGAEVMRATVWELG
ncbi:MAG TPA: 50S ribosomal protein L11 methyltransferase [Caulobacteraceae bacterium]|jgi:predicted nicotinamide N-methyase|nr:50S ribosomal protein L11 methyltransferase [Caulobacteraceae bacterium]